MPDYPVIGFFRTGILPKKNGLLQMICEGLIKQPGCIVILSGIRSSGVPNESDSHASHRTAAHNHTMHPGFLRTPAQNIPVRRKDTE